MINKSELKLLQDGLEKLETGFDDLPEFTPDFDSNAIANVIAEVAERMQDNYPYFHPPIRRANAKTTTPGRSNRVRNVTLGKPEQPRSGRWSRQFGDGKGVHCRIGRHVRLAGPAWPPDRRWDNGKS